MTHRRPTTATFRAKVIAAGLFALAAGPLLAQPVDAQRMGMAIRPAVAPGAPGAGGNVSLPYTVQGTDGNQWRIYQYGHLQQSGNQPLYSQGAMLMVNGNQPMMQNRMARMDEKTGELLLENMQSNGLTVTRRLSFEKDANVVRYIDVIKNTSGQDQNAQIMVQSSMNFGINAAQIVNDPKRAAQQLGWVAQTGGGGCVMEMYNGKGIKGAGLTVNHQQGNNVVSGNYQAALKPGQEVAIMHLHGTMATTDAASGYMTKLKEADIVKKIPQALRKLIVNWVMGSNFVGDVEVLRGDLLDVVELKSGDQLKGTLKQASYELTTFYGPVTLPVDKVVAMMNVGNFRPRQLVVTSDGQIYGGTLKQDSLSVELSSGQVTKIPLSQVSRMGYRKRPGEPDEWTFDKPLVVMRSGERVGVQVPAEGFEVVTKYGKVTLKPDQLASAILQGEDGPAAHRFTLGDGSKFTGLLSAATLDMKLDAAAAGQAVKFPVSAIAKFQLNAKPAEVDDLSPTIRLADEDVLVGSIGGTLKVDTSFDTITVNAAEVRELKRAGGTGGAATGGQDVTVTLFDGSSVSGQLQQTELAVELAGGLKLAVPVALFEEYVQPSPSPGKETEQKITDLVKALSDADWKARDRAQQGLVAIGPVAAGTLKRAREGAAPDVQARIDAVMKELEKAREKPAAKPAGKPGAAGGGVLVPVPIPPNVQQFQLEVEN